jgi:hypothetical protein
VSEGGASFGPGSRLRALVARALFVAAGSMVILATAPFGFTQLLAPACGCASTPTHGPGWTPTPLPPVSPDRASRNASTLAGVDLTAQPDWWTQDGTPIFEPSADGVVALVDGNSGRVLAVVFERRLPESASVTASSATAGTAAAAFITAGGVAADGLEESTDLISGGAVAYYRATWTASVVATAAKVTPALEVLVNASTGEPFAYRDRRSGLSIALPLIGWDLATRLAAASPQAFGEVPSAVTSPPPELQLDVWTANSAVWTWWVGFNDGVLVVDAITGDVSVAKWSSR